MSHQKCPCDDQKLEEGEFHLKEYTINEINHDKSHRFRLDV